MGNRWIPAEEHGYAAYCKGRCRCEEICRPAKRAYEKARRAKNRKEREKRPVAERTPTVRHRRPGVLPLAERQAKVRAEGRKRRRYVIGEVEWLLGTDVASSIARRLGYSSLSSLQKVLYQWGRGDLARALNPERIDGHDTSDAA